MPLEKELNEDVTVKLYYSDMFFFLNVPDVRVSSATGEAAIVAERNEAYAEVCSVFISQVYQDTTFSTNIMVLYARLSSRGAQH